MNSFVISELAIGHVTMVLYDFPYMFRGHILFNKTDEKVERETNLH